MLPTFADAVCVVVGNSSFDSIVASELLFTRIDGIETFVIVNPTARGVKFIPSQAMVLEKARRVQASPALERVNVGTLSWPVEVQSPENFPQGVDIGYGFIIGGMIGAEAFRGKAITTDFKTMTIVVH